MRPSAGSGAGTLAGSSIGPYRVVRKLGSGGMGVVYEAVHKQIGRRAAIKLLHAQFAVQKDIVSRFLNEARAANLVRHPGIVDIYEFGLTPEGSAYIVMEYIDGVSLTARLAQARGPLGLSALPLFQKMAQALAAAHEKGIVHRDLKPDNVMLMPDAESPGGERIKILDFGIAKLSLDAFAEGEADSEEAGASGTQPEFRTRTGAMMGTPAYMAPEQCRGAEQVTDRTDVYSFGLMLYRALSGKPALSARSDLEYLLLHTSAQPKDLHETYQIDAELSALVHAMLAKEPTERPTMAEIAPRLGQLASRLVPAGAVAAFAPTGVDLASAPTAPKLRTDKAGAAPGGRPRAPLPVLGEAEERTTTLGGATGAARDSRAGLPRKLILSGSALCGVLAAVGFAVLHQRQAPQRPVAAQTAPAAATQPATAPDPKPESPAPAPGPAGSPGVPGRVHWEVTTTPPGALVLSAESNDVLGVTPWRHDRDAAQGPFKVLLRLPSFQDTPVTLDRSRDSVVQLMLPRAPDGSSRPTRAPGRSKGAKPQTAASGKSLTNADLPVVE